MIPLINTDCIHPDHEVAAGKAHPAKSSCAVLRHGEHIPVSAQVDCTVARAVSIPVGPGVRKNSKGHLVLQWGDD